VLATGGFQGDPELRASLIHPQARDIPLRGNWYSTGRRACGWARRRAPRSAPTDAGFYGHLMPSGVSFGEHDDFVALSLYYSEHSLHAQPRLRRFVDETVGDHLNTMALLQQPEARGLIVSDSRVRDEWILRPYVRAFAPWIRSTSATSAGRVAPSPRISTSSP
jgi:hypothetical protein